MQATFKVKYPREILFDQIDTGQEFVIAINSPFFEMSSLDMGVTKILAT